MQDMRTFVIIKRKILFFRNDDIYIDTDYRYQLNKSMFLLGNRVVGIQECELVMGEREGFGRLPNRGSELCILIIKIVRDT